MSASGNTREHTERSEIASSVDHPQDAFHKLKDDGSQQDDDARIAVGEKIKDDTYHCSQHKDNVEPLADIVNTVVLTRLTMIAAWRLSHALDILLVHILFGHILVTVFKSFDMY